MKYTKIKGSPVGDMRYVYLERACRECGFSLCGEEKFCPECGHKLLCLEAKVPEDFILGFLNGRYKTIAVREEGNGDIASVTASEGHYTPKCRHGLDKASCGHCTPNGACDMLIYSSKPPKYRMCPFRGDGYIDCKDA